MNPDRIEQLLREADERGRAAGEATTEEFAERVLARFRRRRAIRAGAAVAAVLMIVAGSVMMMSRHHEIPREYARDDKAQAAPPSLNDQIAFQEQMIDRMLAAEQRGRSEARLTGIDVPSADRPLERAAARVVFETDRIIGTSGPTQPALSAYGRVIDCFPDTVSARLARQRLAELIKKEG